MPRLTWPFLLLLAPALSAQAAAPSDSAGAIDAAALFAANCAQCHGLDGSGTGPTVLDRPARNFKEGGFSFGNTPETIARTIAYGIPGSPMPAYDSALDEPQRRALAEYVITLGPPVKEVSEAETLLHVTDRPLIVRGILPPLAEGGPMIPRGLLIGTPDGLTFEYAADDVRLLAVRQGDFVRRTDWGGRGGTPLEPLGKVVWTGWSLSGLGRWFLEKWDPRQSSMPSSFPIEPLHARLLSTSATASLSYSIATTDAAGVPNRVHAIVIETVSSAKVGQLPGFSRRYEVRRLAAAPGDASHLNLMLKIDIGVGREPWFTDPAAPSWWGRATENGAGQLIRGRVVSSGAGGEVAFTHMWDGLVGRVGIAAGVDSPVVFEVATFGIANWTPDILRTLRGEADR